MYVCIPLFYTLCTIAPHTHTHTGIEWPVPAPSRRVDSGRLPGYSNAHSHTLVYTHVHSHAHLAALISTHNICTPIPTHYTALHTHALELYRAREASDHHQLCAKCAWFVLQIGPHNRYVVSEVWSGLFHQKSYLHLPHTHTFTTVLSLSPHTNFTPTHTHRLRCQRATHECGPHTRQTRSLGRWRRAGASGQQVRVCVCVYIYMWWSACVSACVCAS
jgi:hypothetical protein